MQRCELDVFARPVLAVVPGAVRQPAMAFDVPSVLREQRGCERGMLRRASRHSVDLAVEILVAHFAHLLDAEVVLEGVMTTRRRDAHTRSIAPSAHRMSR